MRRQKCLWCQEEIEVSYPPPINPLCMPCSMYYEEFMTDAWEYEVDVG